MNTLDRERSAEWVRFLEGEAMPVFVCVHDSREANDCRGVDPGERWNGPRMPVLQDGKRGVDRPEVYIQLSGLQRGRSHAHQDSEKARSRA